MLLHLFRRVYAPAPYLDVRESGGREKFRAGYFQLLQKIFIFHVFLPEKKNSTRVFIREQVTNNWGRMGNREGSCSGNKLNGEIQTMPSEGDGCRAIF